MAHQSHHDRKQSFLAEAEALLEKAAQAETEAQTRAAAEAEIESALTAREKLRLLQMRKAREEQVEKTRQEAAVFTKLAEQCDDEECCHCGDVMVRLGILQKDSSVQFSDERKAIINEIEAMEVSDAAKKALLELRWR